MPDIHSTGVGYAFRRIARPGRLGEDRGTLCAFNRSRPVPSHRRILDPHPDTRALLPVRARIRPPGTAEQQSEQHTPLPATACRSCLESMPQPGCSGLAIPGGPRRDGYNVGAPAVESAIVRARSTSTDRGLLTASLPCSMRSALAPTARGDPKLVQIAC